MPTTNDVVDQGGVMNRKMFGALVLMAVALVVNVVLRTRRVPTFRSTLSSATKCFPQRLTTFPKWQRMRC